MDRQDENAAFEVRNGEHVYTVYSSGRVDGFPHSAVAPFIIINRIPSLIHAAYEAGRASVMSEALK